MYLLLCHIHVNLSPTSNVFDMIPWPLGLCVVLRGQRPAFAILSLRRLDVNAAPHDNGCIELRVMSTLSLRSSRNLEHINLLRFALLKIQCRSLIVDEGRRLQVLITWSLATTLRDINEQYISVVPGRCGLMRCNTWCKRAQSRCCTVSIQSRTGLGNSRFPATPFKWCSL